MAGEPLRTDAVFKSVVASFPPGLVKVSKALISIAFDAVIAPRKMVKFSVILQ